MKKSCLFFSIFCLALPCKKSKAGEPDKLKFGLTSGVVFQRAQSQFNPSWSPFGLFVNYSVSNHIDFQLELKKNNLLDSADKANPESTFLDFLQRRDWSSSLALNCSLKPITENLYPFLGVGAGQYYIYNSKDEIKKAKQNPEEDNLDYDMREYFKRPGFFGLVGIKYQCSPRMVWFFQTKCSILFEENAILSPQTSNFTDLVNISTGFRLNLN